MYNKQFRRTVLFLAAYAIFTLVCAIPCRSAFTFQLWCGVTSVLELYAGSRIGNAAVLHPKAGIKKAEDYP